MFGFSFQSIFTEPSIAIGQLEKMKTKKATFKSKPKKKNEEKFSIIEVVSFGDGWKVTKGGFSVLAAYKLSAKLGSDLNAMSDMEFHNKFCSPSGILKFRQLQEAERLEWKEAKKSNAKTKKNPPAELAQDVAVVVSTTVPKKEEPREPVLVADPVQVKVKPRTKPASIHTEVVDLTPSISSTEVDAKTGLEVSVQEKLYEITIKGITHQSKVEPTPLGLELLKSTMESTIEGDVKVTPTLDEVTALVSHFNTYAAATLSLKENLKVLQESVLVRVKDTTASQPMEDGKSKNEGIQYTNDLLDVVAEGTAEMAASTTPATKEEKAKAIQDLLDEDIAFGRKGPRMNVHKRRR